MLEVIKLFVRRMLMGKGKGILQIPPQKAVDDFANDLFKKFKQNGVSDEVITNPKDVKIVWEQITNREAQIFNNNLKDALQKPDPFKKAGEVVDLTGKKIKNPKNIMAGEEIKETEAQILQRLKKGNKESLSNMRYEKAVKAEEAKAAADEDYIMKIFDPEDFAYGGVAGLLGERTGYASGNGVADEDAEKAALGKRVRQLMDEEGYDFGEAVRKAMEEGYADGGRTGFRGGGADAGGKSSPGGGTFGGGGGGGGNARENYRTQQYTTPKTKTTSSGGDGGKPKTNIITKSGKDLAALINIGTQGVQSLFGNPFNRKGGFLTKAGLTKGQIENLEEDAKTIGGLKGSITNTTYGSPNNTFGFHDKMDLTDFANSATFGQGSFTTNPTTGKISFDGGNYDFDGKFGKVGDFIDAGGLTGVIDRFGQNLYADQIKNPEMNYLADGGPARQNFAMGKRAFLKLMGGVGAGIAGLKSGLLGLGKGATKKAVTETVKQTAGSGTPPPYFFKLVEKIKMLGDDVTVGSSTTPRTKVTKYKNYELTESLDGSKQIQKIGKEDDMITQNEYMTYTKGQADETTKGKKPADDYEEVTETNSRIYKDNFNDPDYEDGINLKEILKEVDEPAIKKADGGRIGYNIGGLSKLGKIMAGINKKFGKNTMTTADKIVQPEKTIQQRIMEFEARNPKLSEIDKDILIRAKELKLEDNMPYVKNLYRVHRKDEAGIGSLKEFHADFVKETGQNVPIENLRTAWRSKRSYPFNTPVVDKTGKSIGGEATQKMYPESKKFIVEESAESFMKPKIKKTTKREFIDVPPMPKGFKLSREKLEKNYPELDEDMIDQIMDLDKEMQGTVLTMLKNRRQNPAAYDKLLETKGDTLDFQGAFDEVTRKSNNADGGRVSLSGGGLAGMLGE